ITIDCLAPLVCILACVVGGPGSNLSPVGPLPLILKPQIFTDLDCNNGLCHRVGEKEGKRKSSENYIVHCGNFQEEAPVEIKPYRQKYGALLAKEAPVEIMPYRQKDGALLAIGTLVQQSECRIVFRWELHSIMILSECYAAWVAGQYAHINISDPNNICKALPSVVAGMRNPELSVHVDSVFALRSFVKAFKGFLTFLLTLNQLYSRSCAGCLRLMVKTARIFNTYGPRMCLDDGRVVSNFVSQVILVPPPSGRGERVYILSPTYPTPMGLGIVVFFVDGLMALMEGEHIGPFNLGNPGESTKGYHNTEDVLGQINLLKDKGPRMAENVLLVTLRIMALSRVKIKK
ncbi:hypothetical protein Tco_0680994, partial [Tanacetum coccineum]